MRLIPAPSSAPQTRAIPSRPSPVHLIRLLVVEANPAWRRQTSSILRMEGYDVLEAATAADGIRIVLDQLPDLILCDVQLPDADGFSVLIAIRHHPATASTPFIFLTARGEKPDIRAGMNLGADDYLVKPVTRSDLLEAVDARLERQRIHVEQTRRALAEVRFRPDFSSHAPLVDALGLTVREAETLLWVAQGKSNADIAGILGNSEKTVKKTLSHIFEKLGLESRTAAALRAVEILSLPPR
jgi:DNA-binding NarL/FixJ family response regulator